MSPHDIAALPPDMKYGIGQPVPRTEDPVLLRGQGRYTDDISLPGQAYCVIVRSPYAHGIIRGIDTSAAKAMPGVLGAWTGADLKAAGFGEMQCALPVKNGDGSPMKYPTRPSLTTDKVRWVGDPVAFVVAETLLQAKDAAEAVVLDIEPLPAVTLPSASAAPGAPQIFDSVPRNVVLDFHYGDSAKVAEAIAKAAHVTRLSMRNNRVVISPMEPRSAIGHYDRQADRWTIHIGCQGVFGLRNQLAKQVLQVPPEKVRVLTGNVGGSFGMKTAAYPEYACLFHASRLLGRPVKWTDERSGSFVSDHQGRDHETTAELAFDKDGRILAARVTAYGNVGGYMAAVGPNMSTGNYVRNFSSNYAVPLLEVNTKVTFTNTSPVSSYRGAGRPEANYFMERLIEVAAIEMGIDKIELRRRNHVRPEQIPYKAASGLVYDSGDFTTVMEKALVAADWAGFPARKAESRRRGLLRGIGIGNFLEATAQPMKEMGGILFEEDGSVTILTGTLDYGQGHAAPFAQVLHDQLGVPFERIRLVQGDSDRLIAGNGTGGSKSIMASGTAIVEASAKVIDLGRRAASHFLEAAAADIEFARGMFRIAGTDRRIGIMELAQRLRSAKDLPADVPRSLDVKHIFDQAPSAFPNGCHIAEVEIDPDTGATSVVRYVTVNDFGVLVNPLLVEGQTHGGIVQGIGQALYEHTVYAEDGQILTGSYMDYCLPRADDVPGFVFNSHPVPCTTNPLGVKGCGEAGCAGSMPSVINAIVDALSEFGIRHIDMPATPEKVWRAIHSARKAA
ncbi:MAG: xanthine dehydrogenase family protein molybdopterin-binding subunit [Alphaproteobacteria bacterium]|nr:xanthine dehydrogenase family protein molybdopterin-binding subunit [Alphaproteobacteria bacterium]